MVEAHRFRKVLVANRGEIAIRVFRACTEIGIRTVAVYSTEDRLSLHRYKADEAYAVGRGKDPVAAYLGIDEIVGLAREKGADAIHPGYGFLAENADFARACAAAGIAFIGPRPETIALMADKVAARRAAVEAGLPVVPGTDRPVRGPREARAAARSIGWPVIVKAAHGGGGRGMRIARTPAALDRAVEEAAREAAAAFGRPEVFVERFIPSPKHVEVQVLGDRFGGLVHLHERDCSVQRRHQKIVEVAPAVGLPEAARREICDAAVALARHVGYENAGTVEFLWDGRSFFFIEMNTRIQVEHTVTEMITGRDLVKAQIRIAEGHRLGDPEIGIDGQDSIDLRGVAIQCRLTTEDPARDFIPDHGRIEAYRSAAGFGIRLDAGSAHTGAVITPHYDSLLVKVSAWGLDLAGAAARLRRALAEFRVRGVRTNIPFLENVVRHPAFLAGDARTDFIERHPEVLRVRATRDRASRLARFVADVTVNGNPHVKGAGRPERLEDAPVPAFDRSAPLPDGARQVLERRGAEGLARWILREKRVLLTDTTFRDAHQSLLATRMRTYDIVRVAEATARLLPGLFSMECWGGATFDTSLRFLWEDPWERLEAIRARVPNVLLQMLLRASNAVGYTAYPDDVVRRFVFEAAAAGIDVFRVFDSLNWVEAMRPAIDAVGETGKVCEAAISYAGDVLDPRRKKFDLKYYAKMARDLERAGAHILAIKDMAGILKPYAAERLVKVLRDEVGIPIHVHTHDTAGAQAATLVKAVEAGASIVDGAIASMSGLTSQPNLGALVHAFRHTPRETGLDPAALDALEAYWGAVRRFYAPFEADVRAPTSTVYAHEMPGGQYTNLRVQAEALGLADRWGDVVRTYADVNRLLGDIPKVTPSSKVVGDMALFMVANGLTAENVLEKGADLTWPDSVIGYFRGDLGRPPGGWPKALARVVLKGRRPIRGRPGARLAPIRWARVRAELEKKVRRAVTDRDVLTYVLYPQVTVEYLQFRTAYEDVSVLPTPVFLYGMRPGEEVEFELEEGKTLILKLVAIGETDADGQRTVFFEVNGQPREATVPDRSRGPAKARPRADPENLHHVGAPMPGRVVDVKVRAGDDLEKGAVLVVLEAMKMETSVAAPIAGKVAAVHVERGARVEAGDLLAEFA